MRSIMPLVFALLLAGLVSSIVLADTSDWTTDDSSMDFTSTGRWHIAFLTDAYRGMCHSTTALSTGTLPCPNGTWYITVQMPLGDYQVQIWLPNLPNTTHTAVYRVYDDTGITEVVFNQAAGLGWAPLCNQVFSFRSQHPCGKLTLCAETSDADGNIQVIADAVRFVPVPEPSSLLAMLCGIGCVGELVRRKGRTNPT